MAVKEAVMWVYPWDIQDEGITNVLDRLQENGITGINVATLYHSGRFFLPHNPKRKVHFPEPGALYVEPDTSWFESSAIKPPISKFADNEFWNTLRQETKERGMTLTSWILGLHNSQMARAYPDTSVVNAFGDIAEIAVDPAHPDVQEFFPNLLKDVASNFGFDRILLESFEYMPFRHDYHHEVIGVPTTPVIEFFMSLSFSEEMEKRALEKDIDINRVRTYVKQMCEKHFENPHEEVHLTWEEVQEAEDGELKKYLNLRKELNLKLISNISKSVKEVNENITISALDFGPLFGMGPIGTAWENGIDVNEWSRYIDEIHPTFYFIDEKQFQEKVETYKDLIDKIDEQTRPKVVPALRVILPQVQTAEDLKKHVNLLSPIEEGITFYNYGFMSYQAMGWIKEAIK